MAAGYQFTEMLSTTSSSTGDFESWIKGLWGWGTVVSRGSVEGASRRAPSPGTLKMRFLRDMENAWWAGPPLYRGPLKEPRGSSFVGAFERTE